MHDFCGTFHYKPYFSIFLLWPFVYNRFISLVSSVGRVFFGVRVGSVEASRSPFWAQRTEDLHQPLALLVINPTPSGGGGKGEGGVELLARGQRTRAGRLERGLGEEQLEPPADC